MKVLSVVSEVYPLVKTGGLADVAGALPGALKTLGVDVVTVLPGYPAVMASIRDGSAVYTMADLFGGPATIIAVKSGELELFVIDAPHLYDRPGGPYAGPAGDWPDNAFRFAALSRVGAQIAYGEVPGFVPDVLHAHDWQAGLLPAYLRYDGRRQAPSVITVHNLAFQGQFPAALLGSLGLPPAAYGIDGVEYYGSIGYLKAGLALADRVTTVSPTYADEIRTADGGMGLGGLLAARGSDVVGILNGIDIDVWNPASDSLLEQQFNSDTASMRSLNKAALQARFGLEVNPARLLFGVVSRLSWQKGLDLLVETLPKLQAIGAQLALVGTGDRVIQDALQAAADANPRLIGVLFGYDEGLAHQVQGSVDALLVPSRFEPCGLTQLCALRYGALPVVSRVGGLADTVLDVDNEPGRATGVQFSPATSSALETALQRTADLWQEPKAWGQVQQSAMHADVSWRQPAAQYAGLYQEIAGLRG